MSADMRVQEAQAELAKSQSELVEVNEAQSAVEERIKSAQAHLDDGAALLDRLALRDAIEADERLRDRIGDERERIENAVEAAEREVHRSTLRIELAEVEPELDAELRQLWGEAYRLEERLERVRDLQEQRNNLFRGIGRPPAALVEHVFVGADPDEGDRRRVEVGGDQGLFPDLGPGKVE